MRFGGYFHQHFENVENGKKCTKYLLFLGQISNVFDFPQDVG